MWFMVFFISNSYKDITSLCIGGIIYIELIRGTDVIYHCGQVKPDLSDIE